MYIKKRKKKREIDGKEEKKWEEQKRHSLKSSDHKKKKTNAYIMNDTHKILLIVEIENGKKIGIRSWNPKKKEAIETMILRRVENRKHGNKLMYILEIN